MEALVIGHLEGDGQLDQTISSREGVRKVGNMGSLVEILEWKMIKLWEEDPDMMEYNNIFHISPLSMLFLMFL